MSRKLVIRKNITINACRESFPGGSLDIDYVLALKLRINIKIFDTSEVTDSENVSDNNTKSTGKTEEQVKLVHDFLRSGDRAILKCTLTLGNDSMRPPQFTQKLKNLTINDGEHLKLAVKVDGNPEPQITWSKEDKMLSSSEIIDLKYKNKVVVTINEVFSEDEYACLATNSIGSDTTSCKLAVKAGESVAGKKKGDDKSPKIVDYLTSKYVKDGDTVTLSCRIIDAKKFDVVWLYNNKEIRPSKEFQYTSEANIYKLIISEIFPEDSGTYTCKTFNNAGESY